METVDIVVRGRSIPAIRQHCAACGADVFRILQLVGAEAVVESGGVVGTIGTASIAANAKALSKPFY
eukprot:10431307-Prorocentrum_lima.AAC.1